MGVHHVSETRVRHELLVRAIPIPLRLRTCYNCKATIRTITCLKTKCTDKAASFVSKKRTQADVPLPDKPTAKSKRQKHTPAIVGNIDRLSETVVPCVEQDNPHSKHVTAEYAVYVASLRRLLVERLKDEEEFERLTMYARDDRFNANGGAAEVAAGAPSVGHAALPHAHERESSFHAILCCHESLCFKTRLGAST